MIVSPTRGLRKLMQITYMSWDFKLYLIGLGALYVILAWIGEHYVFQRLAKAIGHARVSLLKKTKQRKEYKIIQEEMLF